MTADPASDVLRWVRDGERLFGEVLQSLHRCQELAVRVETLEAEKQHLRQELRAMQVELEHLRSERVETAESLRAIAEHVTRLATAALQRLGRPLA